MLDLSDAGARLKVDPGTALPAQFILVMSRDGRLNRRCRTVWRNEDMLGVQFLSQKSVGPKPTPEARRFEIRLPEGFMDDDAAEPAADSAEPAPDPQSSKEPAAG